MVILDFVVCLLVLILGFNLKNRYRMLDGYDKSLLNKIFLVHMVICCVATPILIEGGDAFHYWQAPKEMNFDQIWEYLITDGRPTSIMFFLNYFLSNSLELSFLSGMFIYAFFGYWAFIFMLLTIKTIIPQYRLLSQIKLLGLRVLPLIFLMPNLHFWSVSVGKDTLLFFSIMLFIYSIINIRTRFVTLMVSVFIAFFLRPHMLLFLVSGFGVAYLFQSKLAAYKRIVLLIIAAAIFFPLLNSVLKFAQIDSLTTSQIVEFNKSKSEALSNAGSGLDMSNYPYPLKVLSFLFRPLFFDAFNVLSLIASVENLFYLLLFLKFLKNQMYKTISGSNYIVKGSLFFYLIGALAFAPIMSNLGIMIREKNMFIPAFLIFVLYALYKNEILPKLRTKNEF